MSSERRAATNIQGIIRGRQTRKRLLTEKFADNGRIEWGKYLSASKNYMNTPGMTPGMDRTRISRLFRTNKVGLSNVGRVTASFINPDTRIKRLEEGLRILLIKNLKTWENNDAEYKHNPYFSGITLTYGITERHYAGDFIHVGEIRKYIYGDFGEFISREKSYSGYKYIFSNIEIEIQPGYLNTKMRQLAEKIFKI